MYVPQWDFDEPAEDAHQLDLDVYKVSNIYLWVYKLICLLHILRAVLLDDLQLVFHIDSSHLRMVEWVDTLVVH